jgi:hypothetical protein
MATEIETKIHKRSSIVASLPGHPPNLCPAESKINLSGEFSEHGLHVRFELLNLGGLGLGVAFPLDVPLRPTTQCRQQAPWRTGELGSSDRPSMALLIFD